MHGTDQYKLDSTPMWHGLNTTCFQFTCVQACRAHKIDDMKPIVQSSRVYTRCVHNNLQMHVAHAKFGFVHANCKPRTVEHVLRCNSLVIQNTNPAKNFLL